MADKNNQAQDKKISIIEQIRRDTIKGDVNYSSKIFAYEGTDYTFNDVYNAYLNSGRYRGKSPNKESIKKYYELRKLVEQLHTICPVDPEIEFNDVERNSRWATVYVKCLCIISFEHETMTILKKMLEVADDFYVFCLKAGKLTLTFGIKNIWHR